MRWLHVLNAKHRAALPASMRWRGLYMHFGTYLLATARTPDGILFEYRQRLTPRMANRMNS